MQSLHSLSVYLADSLNETSSFQTFCLLASPVTRKAMARFKGSGSRARFGLTGYWVHLGS